MNDPFGYGLIALTVGIGVGLFGIFLDFSLSLIIKKQDNPNYNGINNFKSIFIFSLVEIDTTHNKELS